MGGPGRGARGLVDVMVVVEYFFCGGTILYGGRRFGVCNSVNFLMSQKFHRIVMLLLFLFCCWRTTILPLHEHTYGEAKRILLLMCCFSSSNRGPDNNNLC